ncbi:MAG: polyprenyl synthetase family protein [Phycisphaerales bacterium]
MIARVDDYLTRFLDHQHLPPNLDAAIRYSLLGGGKRVRPALAWFSAVACGGCGEASLPAGSAIEMVHAFSLIHDDLPAMDDDDMRRGRPTLHRHTNEAMAILAGDAMLSLAYEAVLTHPEPAIALHLCQELGLGTRRMIEGQVYDTLGGMPGALSEIECVELIHRNKTGALLRASCRMGAISAGASEAALDAITRYSEAIGLQFQIIDDLLDVEGCSQALGKATGKDQAAGKRPTLACWGLISRSCWRTSSAKPLVMHSASCRRCRWETQPPCVRWARCSQTAVPEAGMVHYRNRAQT